MTVSELIDELKEMPEDSVVMFSYNYGDYWGTHVCADVHRVEVCNTVYSDYHQMYKIDLTPDEEDTDDEQIECVILQ